jgi:DNA-binding transcriptional LysR family regulator
MDLLARCAIQFGERASRVVDEVVAPDGLRRDDLLSDGRQWHVGSRGHPWIAKDPTRRQLAERAQRAGVTIRPRIEVQHANATLQLAARGVGDTLVTRALLYRLGYRDDLAAVSLDPPLHETFAFIQRRNARLSPATRALMTLAEQHLTSLVNR